MSQFPEDFILLGMPSYARLSLAAATAAAVPGPTEGSSSMLV